MWIRFQLTVAPAERERDVQKTGLAYPLTKVKRSRIGNSTVAGTASKVGAIRNARQISRHGAGQSPTRGALEQATDNLRGKRGSNRLRLDGVSPYRCCFASIGYVRTSRVVEKATNGKATSLRYEAVSDRHGHRSQAGFTRTELMTVLGLVGILVTLGISAASSVRTSARQITCGENLMVIGMAVNRYSEETGHRPRSFTRLMDSRAGTNLMARLICPTDPALNRSQRNQTLREMTWGNLANESQDPGVPSVVGEPESGSWQIEIKERKETVAFSYLHPLGWTRTAWDRLRAQGPPFGVAVCQLHGVRVPSGPSGPDRRNYMEYEGRFLRAQTDGAVVRRKLFREPDSPVNAVTTAAPPPLDYPWEFYTDRPVPSLK